MLEIAHDRMTENVQLLIAILTTPTISNHLLAANLVDLCQFPKNDRPPPPRPPLYQIPKTDTQP